MAVFLGGMSMGMAFAQSSDVAAALTEASKLMQKGGYVKAIETIDGALRVGKVPGDLAAKALLMRAEANEKLGRSAFAMADYNNALFMEQSLTPPERKRAQEGRGRVMKGLGVADSAPAGAAAPATIASTATAPATTAPATTASTAPANGGSGASGKQRSQASQASWNTAVQETPGEEKTGGIGGFFGNLFSSSSTATRSQSEPTPSAANAVVAQTSPERPPSPKVAPKKPAAAASPPAAAQPPAKAKVGQAPTTAAVKPPEGGNFAIQLAAVAEEDKAIAEADRIAKKFSGDLGGRSPSLMIVPTSDGGTLYKIVAAPFETRGEGQATCELLKSKGINCMVISKK